jgi:hypothetical protein
LHRTQSVRHLSICLSQEQLLDSIALAERTQAFHHQDDHGERMPMLTTVQPTIRIERRAEDSHGIGVPA